VKPNSASTSSVCCPRSGVGLRAHSTPAICIGARTTAAWTDKLLAAGVPCGPIHTIDRVFADPQVKHLGMARPMRHPELGLIEVVGLPMQFSAHPREATPLAPAPDQGQHTDAILHGLGYSPDRIAQLRESLVV
jgi:crotonobetainyl-CoA:carnitine CoA-transferase CaiB-like acyl-CoA transferase